MAIRLCDENQIHTNTVSENIRTKKSRIFHVICTTNCKTTVLVQQCVRRPPQQAVIWWSRVFVMYLNSQGNIASIFYSCIYEKRERYKRKIYGRREREGGRKRELMYRRREWEGYGLEIGRCLKLDVRIIFVML